MEYYSKCTVCGKINCYTDNDLKNNKNAAIATGLSSLGMISSALVGTKYDMYEMGKISDRANSKIVDYSKCPNCGSKDVVLVTKKFAIFSNKANGNYSTVDLLKEANQYLEKKYFEDAFCFATMVLNEGENNFDAYLIRFFASFGVRSFDEINDLYIDYSDNNYYNDLLLVANENQKRMLLSYCQNNKYNIIMNNVEKVLEMDDDENILQDLEKCVIDLRNYDDANSKKLLDSLDSKKAEVLNNLEFNKKYKLGCEYLEKNDLDDIIKAFDIFSELNDYKDSKDKIKKYKEKLYKSGCEYLEKNNLDDIAKSIDIFNVLDDYKESNEELRKYREKLYKSGCENLEKNNLDDIAKSIDIFNVLGDYKDSKCKLNACQEIIDVNKKSQNKDNIIFTIICILIVVILIIISLVV